MTDTQAADSTTRRRALIGLVVFAAIGALLILGFSRYRQALFDWVLADPADARRRVSLVFFLSAGLLAAPLLMFAGYLWSLGAKVIASASFPPPGHRSVADTPSLTGAEAIQRGRAFKGLGVFLAVAAVVLWLLVWQLAGLFAGRAQ